MCTSINQPLLITSRFIIIQMPFSSPKVKALGILLQNRHGAKFYSKYYTKHSALDFSKTEFNLNNDDAKLKLEKSLAQKIKKMNILSSMTP